MNKERHLKLARTLVRLLEKSFKIGKFEFGLDPIVGLVPTIGDFIPAIIAFYVVYVAFVHKISFWKLVRMIINILLDLLLGLVPVLGDILDFVVDSNSKNLRILEAHIDKTNGVIEGEIVE